MIHQVLMLHQDAKQGSYIAASNCGPNLKVVAASDFRDAIGKLANGKIDLLLVDASLTSPSPVEFLAMARQKVPRVLRAVLTAAPASLEAEALVNAAGVHAIFTNPLDKRQLAALIDEYARLQTPANPGGDVEPYKIRIAELETKLKKAERDLRIARTADGIIRDEELNLAELNAKKAKSKLGAEISLDYHSQDMEAEVSKALDAMLDSPNVELPILPQIGQELRQLMKDGDVAFDKVAELVAMDASLSGRVLSICNSPVYAGLEPIVNLNQAVARLGVQAMRDAVQTAASENLFKTELKGMQDLLAKLWMHSLATAHANMLVAQSLAIEESEDFFVLGLLHDIGKLLICTLIQQGFDHGLWNPKMVTPPMVLSLMKTRHNELGVKLMEKWQYPEIFADVIGNHNDDANIQKHREPVVVTYYSNVLTRKLGYSLMPYEGDILSGHDLAQALNMAPDTAAAIESSSEKLIAKIKDSYF